MVMETLSSVVTPLMTVLGLVMVVMGLVKLMSGLLRQDGGTAVGLAYLVFGSVVMMAPRILPDFSKALAEALGGTSTTPSDKPDPAPSASSEPAGRSTWPTARSAPKLAPSVRRT